MMEIGKYMPEGEIVRGRYVGRQPELKGITCLMCDRGEYWSLQVDHHPEGLMMYGWWKCFKDDWRRIYTIGEAIKQIEDGKLWARPISWTGSGLAIHVYNRCRVAVVPSATGGKAWNVHASDLMEEWEVVEPNIVLDETCTLSK